MFSKFESAVGAVLRAREVPLLQDPGPGLQRGQVDTKPVYGYVRTEYLKLTRERPELVKWLRLNPDKERPNRIAKGAGLVALQPIAADTFVGSYGTVMPPFRRFELDSCESADFYGVRTATLDPYEGHQLWCFDFPSTQDKSLLAYMSHSCAPNCEVRELNIRGQLVLCLYTTRTIEPGEELTWDYSAVTDKPDEQMLCACESENCQKYCVKYQSAGSLAMPQHAMTMASDRLLPEETAALRQVHFGTALLGTAGAVDEAPWWLQKTAARMLDGRLRTQIQDIRDDRHLLDVATMLLHVRRYLMELPRELQFIEPIMEVSSEWAHREVLLQHGIVVQPGASATKTLEELVEPISNKQKDRPKKTTWSASERDIGCAYLQTKRFFTVPLEWLQKAREVPSEPIETPNGQECVRYNISWLLAQLFRMSKGEMSGTVILPRITKVSNYDNTKRAQLVNGIEHGDIDSTVFLPPNARPILLGSPMLDKYMGAHSAMISFRQKLVWWPDVV